MYFIGNWDTLTIHWQMTLLLTSSISEVPTITVPKSNKETYIVRKCNGVDSLLMMHVSALSFVGSKIDAGSVVHTIKKKAITGRKSRADSPVV
mmetsp:Transcript_41768/g.77286  ORF Transcript_41768/g.77286 Transcript_41768/m.77286 type:complete len:93 (+) Transcript_41768:891-1169(+)